jgi:hypothetical protein
MGILRHDADHMAQVTPIFPAVAEGPLVLPVMPVQQLS